MTLLGMRGEARVIASYVLKRWISPFLDIPQKKRSYLPHNAPAKVVRVVGLS